MPNSREEMSDLNTIETIPQGNLWDQYFNMIENNYSISKDGLKNLLEILHSLGIDHFDKTIHDIRFLMNPKLYPFTNKIVTEEFFKTKGESIRIGFEKMTSDYIQNLAPALTQVESFSLGENIAATEGYVIFQNEIMQLIHYKGRQKKIHSSPILIIPPWINKYYIFDLAEEKSFIQFGIKNGLDMYIISWKNPTGENKNTSLNCYIQKGIETAINLIGEPVNLMGFCLGGVATLIAGLMHNRGIIKSMTLLATPIDFSKLYELQKFGKIHDINDYCAKIKKKGYKCGKDLLRMFCLMKPDTMIVNNIVEQYYLGRNPKESDFLYWNMDSTNLPARMHLEYLDKFVRKNLLIKGKLKINRKKIDLGKINFPMFIVATEKDHIVPPESAFAIYEFLPDARYILAGSGHVAGIINPPENKKYGYKVFNKYGEYVYKKKYSWWTEWLKWVKPLAGNKISKLMPHQCLEPAPGSYAMEQPSLEPYYINENKKYNKNKVYELS